MNHIIHLNEATCSDNVGGKAFHLAELIKVGITIPEAIVIKASAFELFVEKHKDILNPSLEKLYAKKEYSDYTSFAKNIAELIAKCNIPEEILIDGSNFISQLFSKGYTGVAVRSSCNMEDTDENTFAGQYETVLNVRTREEFSDAIKTCWASLYNQRVLQYCYNNSIDHQSIKINLLVQGMVNADCAGVLFTVNPLTGNDKEMVLEAVYGLGEALVQGVVTPDMYHYNWYDEKFEIIHSGKQEKYLTTTTNGSLTQWKENKNTTTILSEAQVNKLSQTALQIQKFYGAPQDIEWAIQNEKIVILQSRPLTSITFKVDDEWTTADLKDGGISCTNTTPFMYSLYEYAFESSMPAFLKSLHVYPKKKPAKWFNWWMGYSYWNMKAVKEGAKKIPGFIERKFDQDLGIEPDYKGDGYRTYFTPVSLFNGIRILMASNRSIAQRPFICKDALQKIKTIFFELEHINMSKINDANLFSRFRKLITEDYLLTESSYFSTIYDNSNATTFFHEALEKYNKKKKEKINYLQLITGLQNLSHLKPIYDLWDIRTEIKQDIAATIYFSKSTADMLKDLFFSNEDFPFKNNLQEYFIRYKYHSIRELDILVPHWIEDPKQVFETILDFLQQPDDNDPRALNKKQNTVYLESRKKIISKSLLKKLDIHRHLLWWREEMRDHSTKMYFWIRMFCLEMEKRLLAQKLLKIKDDIFYLRFDEVFKLLENYNTPILISKIEKNKLFYQCFTNFNKPNEILGRKAVKKKARDKNLKVFKGIACSPGNVEAKVCVIKSIYDVDKLIPGTILVTKFTDPAWTPAFAKIKGLITETGGILSHGAVVSREYGIPAVLAVQDITDILKDKMNVRIDGDTGEVTIL